MFHFLPGINLYRNLCIRVFFLLYWAKLRLRMARNVTLFFSFFEKIQTHMANISHLLATTNDAAAAADAAAGW